MATKGRKKVKAERKRGKKETGSECKSKWSHVKINTHIHKIKKLQQMLDKKKKMYFLLSFPIMIQNIKQKLDSL